MRKVETTAKEKLSQESDGPISRGIKDLVEILGEEVDDKFTLPVTYPNPLTGGNDVFMLEFRYPESADQMDEQVQAQIEFVQRIQDGIKDGSLHPPYRKVLELKKGSKWKIRDLANAFAIHFWSHADDKITETQALHIVAVNPSLGRSLVRQLDVELQHKMMVFNFGGVNEAKKNLRRVQQNNSDSRQLEPTTKNTPTI